MSKLKALVTMGLLFVSIGIRAETSAKPIDITVNRSPSCSCCGRWVEHLKQNGFAVQDNVTEGVQAIKDKYGITPELASCHTAIVEGYAVEGHVPAADIQAMLKAKPKIVGLSVPAMPVGTPGMEMGTKKDAYDVISFDNQKNAQIFKHYEGAE
jgi:hypothetical protein